MPLKGAESLHVDTVYTYIYRWVHACGFEGGVKAGCTTEAKFEIQKDAMYFRTTWECSFIHAILIQK